jgi:iron complex transport system substrate-binding protein
MRFRPAALLLAAVLLALAGCGSDDEPSSAAAKPATTTEPASAFPVTVAHRFGTTTVPSEPERVAIVGLTEQDIVLALGVVPVATTEWYGGQPSAVWPWAQDRLGGAKPTVLSNADGFQFERIAKLEPDLIIGTNSGMKQEDYEKLSAIAPTIPGVRGGTDYFSPWDQQTELVAAALGRPEKGKELVREVKDAYAKAAAEHPDFKGKTATFIQNAFYDGKIYAYPDGLNTEFLTYLGFAINPRLNEVETPAGEQVGLSQERFDLADADVMVFATEKAGDVEALEKVPTFQKLQAVRDGRVVYTDGTLAGALYFMTPLSLMYALDRLVPALDAAVKGGAPRRMMQTNG